MREFVDRLNAQSLDRHGPRPDRSEVADIWRQLGLSDGFSVEWVLDRIEQTDFRAGRRI